MKTQHILPMIVFYSYAREDEELRNCLERHLSLLEHEGFIRHWHDRLIVAGTERLQAINQTINDASIIFLLISSDFLASRRCYEIEMPYALQHHKHGTTRAIPIILRPCDWQTAPFAELECLPRSGKAVTEWDDQDAAFRDIARNLRCTLNLLLWIQHHSLPTSFPFLKPFLSNKLLVNSVQQKFHYDRLLCFAKCIFSSLKYRARSLKNCVGFLTHIVLFLFELWKSYHLATLFPKIEQEPTRSTKDDRKCAFAQPYK